MPEETSWQLYLASVAAIGSLISALAAVAAAIVGPIAAYKIAVRSVAIGADVSERKEWIQQFRDDVASYITKALMVRLYFDGRTSEPMRKVYNELEQFTALFYRIVMRLDITKPAHLEMLNSLDLLHIHCRSDPPTLTEVDFHNLHQRILNQSRELILIELDEMAGRESIRTFPKYRARKEREPERPVMINDSV